MARRVPAAGEGDGDMTDGDMGDGNMADSNAHMLVGIGFPA